MQATLVNGTDGQHNWNAINWRESNRIVRNLRGRIYKATQAGDYSTVRNLQKLMLRSRSNAYESVRKVTQVNAGKNTAGVDKLLVKTSAARSELVKEVVTVSVWQASVVKRIYIPKANGKQRPLGIPTIRDRVIQAIVKNALEPEWEAKFEGISYGFRPGRSTHDAIQAIHAIACKGKKMWVVDADIKGAFDNIAHQPLLEQIGDFPAKKLVEKWLKAGVMEKGQYSETTAGTPQGGVISPLLANIALHGMELALGIRRSSKYMLRTHERSIVRYADDFVVFCKTAEDAQKAVQTLAQWLKDKGLELSEEKTKIVHLEKGFDFLGFNIRSYPTKSKKPSNDKRQTPYKLRIKPSKKAEQTFRDKVKAIWKEMKGEDITTVIYRINPILKGWGNYYRHVMKRQTFSRLDKWLWKRQMKWAKFKHLQKSSKWIRQKYFGKLVANRNDYWVFGDKKKKVHMMRLSWINHKQHYQVKTNYSPDDPNLKDYWQARRNKVAHLRKDYLPIARLQNYKCPICGKHLAQDDEELHLHHVIQDRNNPERNLWKNQQILHYYCHLQVHSQQTTTMKKGGDA